MNYLAQGQKMSSLSSEALRRKARMVHMYLECVDLTGEEQGDSRNARLLTDMHEYLTMPVKLLTTKRTPQLMWRAGCFRVFFKVNTFDPAVQPLRGRSNVGTTGRLTSIPDIGRHV